ncbi:MAG TPA: YciI family protein [Acetobacteraceae bacterium]|nr:YciI family protein [Acetobacteraceae bacterium]
MLFMLICTDRPGGLDLRMATRPAHLAYLETEAPRIMSGGAMLDPEGKPCGSLLVIEATDRAEAEGFAAGDPYAKAGLFESTMIRPFRQVYKDGAKIAP